MSLFLLFGSVTAVLAAFAAVVASAREFGFDAFRPTVTRKLRQCKVKVKFLVGIEGKICVFFPEAWQPKQWLRQLLHPWR